MTHDKNFQLLLDAIVSKVLNVPISSYLERFADEDGKNSDAVTPMEKLKSPKNHRSIVALNSHNSVEHALKTLTSSHIHAAPVRDTETGKWLGFIDMLDIVFLAINMATKGIDTHKANVVEEWKTWCASNDPETLNHRGVRFGLKPVKSVINESHVNKFIPVYENGTLAQLVEEIFAKGIHRAPVMDFAEGNIVDIITQTDIVTLLAENISDLGPILDCTVEELGLVSENVISMSAHAQAIHAFWLMKFHAVTGVAVAGGKKGELLLGNISATDLKYLSSHKFSSLLKPVLSFFSNSYDEEGTTDKSDRLFGDLRKHPVIVNKKSTFRSLLIKMDMFKVHRVWVVDEACESPIGVITTNEIMTMIAKGL